ncbi:MAG: PAS domain S-box protein [Nitrospinota bacterium]|nr:PAS domain S-box protein [Nitrospinota bacterium]
MDDRLLRRLAGVRPAYIVLVSVLASVSLTLVIVSICSLYFYGRVTFEFIATGIIASFFVAFLVVMFLQKITNSIMEVKLQSDSMIQSLEKNISNIIQKSNDVFYRTNLKGEIVWISQSVQKVMGYSPEELIGKDISSFYVNPEERLRLQELLRENGGFVKNFEAKLRKKDGSEIWLSTDTGYYYDEHGSIAGVEGETKDVTEKKEIENALRLSEEKYRTLIENIQEGIFLLQEGKFVYVNDRFAEMTGYKVAEIIGKEFAPFVAPEDRNKVFERYKRRLQGEDVPKEYEFRLLHKDGNARVVVHMLVSLTQYQGKLATTGTITNVSEKRKMETLYQKAQKLESVGLLAGGIAHDFNNLLTSILGGLSLLKLTIDKSGDDEDLQIVTESINATKRAKDLARQLLSFSKGSEPVKKLLSLKDLLMDCVSFSLRGSLSNYSFDIVDDLWNVEADEGQLNQVFNNLIINAEQSMPDGGVIDVCAYNINISSHSGIPLPPGKYVQITVEDAGHGIPDEYLDKIFDPYFTSKQKGSGLGLASAYSIIRNHGGFIDVESDLGKGSRFHVFVPASDLAINEYASSPALVKGHGRVLVMDDEDVVRNVLGRMLKRLGYETEYAVDGEEAVSIYRQNLENGTRFKAIITDLTIPGGMGGEKVLKILKEADPEIKAIATSGYALDPIMSDYPKYGFAGILQKPFEMENLSVVLEKVTAENGGKS